MVTFVFESRLLLRDFSKFSEEHFDSKAWINAAFRAPEAQNQNREEVAGAMVTKLQLFIGEVNKSLEETSGQILNVMPRLVREVETMQSEAVLLQNRMQSLQQDVRKVETNTTLAMESLLAIDAEKTKIHAVEKALQEVENWSLLTSDMEEIFGSGDVEAMAERLRTLQHSLQVMGRKVADYPEKAELVERLKDQFLAVISPSLVGAFTARHPPTVLYYKQICSELGRGSELGKYYAKCLKVSLTSTWTELLETHPHLEPLWSALFDQLLAISVAEVKWCESCGFDDPGAMISLALAKSLEQLEPSLVDTLRDRLDLETDKLPTLVHLKQASESFLASLSTTLRSEEGLSSAVLQPLLPFLSAYQQYQQSLLLEKLGALAFESDLTSAVSVAEATVEGVFADAIGALDTCALLTGPPGLPLLLKALQTYLGNYTSLLRKLVELAKPAKDEDAVQEDWSRAGTLLQLLKVMGLAFLRLERLEEALGAAYSALESQPGLAAALGTSFRTKKEEDEEIREEALGPLESALLQEGPIRSALQELVLARNSDANAPFLPDIGKQLGRLNQKSLRLLSLHVYGPIEGLLVPLPKLPAWSAARMGEAAEGEALPSFALSPQEYITKVGAYLMTLAHHLEPCISAEDSALAAALRKGTLPHIPRDRKPGEGSEAAVALVMESAGCGAMARFVDAASRIPSLSSPGASQLITDIEYLCNVVEDLGLEPSDTLASLRELLAMDRKKLESGTTSSAYPATLISEVRSMRGYTTKD